MIENNPNQNKKRRGLPETMWLCLQCQTRHNGNDGCHTCIKAANKYLDDLRKERASLLDRIQDRRSGVSKLRARLSIVTHEIMKLEGDRSE